MNMDCKFLGGCGFFRKYEATKSLACKGFINTYCKGDKQMECKRMAFKKANGSAPSDDMMPTGHMILS